MNLMAWIEEAWVEKYSESIEAWNSWEGVKRLFLSWKWSSFNNLFKKIAPFSSCTLVCQWGCFLQNIFILFPSLLRSFPIPLVSQLLLSDPKDERRLKKSLYLSWLTFTQSWKKIDIVCGIWEYGLNFYFLSAGEIVLLALHGDNPDSKPGNHMFPIYTVSACFKTW